MTAYDLIVVTGYAPVGARTPMPLHPIARERVMLALASYLEGAAPLILTSGGRVHPLGTPFCEAIEMKHELCALGVPADAIVTDEKARHSTTNLRNAGRVMLSHGLSRALVVCGGGWRIFNQAWYFAHPHLSGFHRRCQRALGYRVGTLRRVDSARVAFSPFPDCTRPGPDPLDP